MKKQIFQYVAGFTVFLIVIGYILPEKLVIPVMGAKTTDWNQQTFWYEPWGKSKVHKGIDIFAKKGTLSLAAIYGLVIYSGRFSLGGNVIAVLGPKWKIHYYAHLESINVSIGEFVSTSQRIGAVVNSGNARGKQPHLHYSVITLLPYFWRWDDSTFGWKKIFFLNPSEMLLSIYTKV